MPCVGPAPLSDLISSILSPSLRCTWPLPISSQCRCLVLDLSHQTDLRSKVTSLTIHPKVAPPQLLSVKLTCIILFSKHFPYKITFFRAMAFICCVPHGTPVPKATPGAWSVLKMICRMEVGREECRVPRYVLWAFGDLCGLAVTHCLHAPPPGRYLRRPPRCTRR